MTDRDQIQFILDNCMQMPAKQMARQLGRSNCFVRSVMKRHGIVVPAHVTDRFRKESQFNAGHEPYNKGKSIKDSLSPEAIQRMSKTQFKKGNQPHNTKTDGCISIRNHKTVLMKWIRLSSAKWVHLHRHIWEQHHGEIPKGYNIQFKDGDTLNCDISNLYLISRKESVYVNGKGGRSLPYELIEPLKTNLKIINKIKSYEKQSIRPQ